MQINFYSPKISRKLYIGFLIKLDEIEEKFVCKFSLIVKASFNNEFLTNLLKFA